MISDSAPNQIYMYNASLPSLKLTVRRTLNKTLTDHNNYANGNCGQFNTFIVYEINARQRTIVVFNLPSTTIESQHNYFVIWRPVWTLLLLLLLYRLSFDFFRLRSTKFRVFFLEFYILKSNRIGSSPYLLCTFYYFRSDSLYACLSRFINKNVDEYTRLSTDLVVIRKFISEFCEFRTRLLYVTKNVVSYIFK